MVGASASGKDVRVTVKDDVDYCGVVATHKVTLEGGTIHVFREKPTAVARGMCGRNLSLLVHGVPAGTYKVSYEETPYAKGGPAVTVGVASVTVP